MPVNRSRLFFFFIQKQKWWLSPNFEIEFVFLIVFSFQFRILILLDCVKQYAQMNPIKQYMNWVLDIEHEKYSLFVVSSMLYVLSIITIWSKIKEIFNCRCLLLLLFAVREQNYSLLYRTRIDKTCKMSTIHGYI